MVGAARRKSKLPRKILRVLLDDGSFKLQPQNAFEETGDEESDSQLSNDIQCSDEEEKNPVINNENEEGNENFVDNNSEKSISDEIHLKPLDLEEEEKFDVEKKNSKKANKHQHPEPNSEYPYQCDVCDLLFKTLELLSDHQHTVHDSNQQFVCRYCSKKFNDKYNMRKHVLIHVGEKRHKCSFCDKAFLRKDHLRSHLHTHYNRKYGCKICGKGFRTMDMYERHSKTHKDQSACKDNLQVFTLNKKDIILQSENHLDERNDVSVTILDDNFDLWVKDESPSNETESNMVSMPSAVNGNADSILQCVSCKSSFRDELTLQIHEKECTGDSQKWHCLKCDIIFDEAAILRQHYEKVHSLESAASTPTRWKCKMCDIDFSNSKDLSRHYTQSHKDSQLFPCSECTKTFTVWHNLKKHMLIHLGDKKHKCNVCHKGFVRKDHLNSHMKVHSGDNSPKFTCPECSKVFRVKHLYSKHISTHNRSRR
ncbi:zinc finger protein 567 [Hydra vulgaris]|uniref:Zinc finger protein 567 n=1 Tax=Hydra vulgaris TaxID=6087 RepID=A0ABM4B847_HYDVU